MFRVKSCVGLNSVWLSLVRLGLVWYGLVWFGLIWLGFARAGPVWLGIVCKRGRRTTASHAKFEELPPVTWKIAEI